MDFRILGPLEVVTEDGKSVPLGGPKQRAVLAILLLRRGAVVSVDDLVDQVWSGRAPSAAMSSLQAYVSKLRGILDPSPGVSIVTKPPGYALVGADVDADRFESLVSDAKRAAERGELEPAAEKLRAALKLWRGDALADFAYEDFARREAARLLELKLQAAEDLFDAELALGRHAEVAAEVQALQSEHPLRERLLGQCMLALYRCGRQAEALDLYERGRVILAEELGVDPSPELREIHARIVGHRDSVAELPSGVVTFLLTDIEGSTRLWDGEPRAMAEAHRRQDEIVAEHAAKWRAGRPRDQGEGDSVLLAFERASDAVSCALELQQSMCAERWPTASPIRVRIAIATGEAELRDGNYFGVTVNRCARLRGIARGGQIVLAAATVSLVADALPQEASLRDLGPVRLKDLARPEHAAQLLHPSLPDDPPAVEVARHNLPVQLTTFVGRERVVADVRTDLTHSRLVTLIGPGGAGKTRLAVEAAAGLIDAYPDGVCFVDLARLRAGDLVAQQVAGVLGVPEEADRPMAQTLADALRARHTLVILDNCEHTIDAAASLADSLLRGCPHLRILATSREPLRVDGERRVPVPPLALPDPADPEAAAASEAFRLFCERASAVKPGFDIGPDDLAAVTEICRRLDGIPLAIELAAAAVGVMSPRQIADRLDDRFRLLSSGPRAALPRQQTLQGLVDWSYDLLDDDERRLFEQLSVLQSSFRLETVEDLAGDPCATMILGSLVEKSLVMPDSVPGRYRMLETIREYASVKLEASGEEGAVRLRSLDRMLRLAESPGTSGGLRQWIETVTAQIDDMRAALSWSLEGDGPDELGARLCVALRRFWADQGAWIEGLRWTQLALRLEVPEPARADLEESAGELAGHTGDAATSVRHLEAAVAIRRSLGDSQALARTLRDLARALAKADDYRPANAALNESLQLFREHGDVIGACESMIEVGRIAELEGRYSDAALMLSDALDVARTAGSQHHAGLALYRAAEVECARGYFSEARTLLESSLQAHQAAGENESLHVLLSLGRVAMLAGEPDAAEVHYSRALALADEAGLRHTVAAALHGLGRLAERRGDHARARTLYQEQLELMREIGSMRGTAHALTALVGLDRSRGDDAGATQTLGEALAILRESGDRFFCTAYLEELAAIASARYEFERAALLFGAADGQRERLGILATDESLRPSDLAEALDRLRDGLGAAELEEWTARGRAMSMDEAVDIALRRDTAYTSTPSS